jgi:hypothetical protein
MSTSRGHVDSGLKSPDSGLKSPSVDLDAARSSTMSRSQINELLATRLRLVIGGVWQNDFAQPWPLVRWPGMKPDLETRVN